VQTIVGICDSLKPAARNAAATSVSDRRLPASSWSPLSSILTSLSSPMVSPVWLIQPTPNSDIDTHEAITRPLSMRPVKQLWGHAEAPPARVTRLARGCIKVREFCQFRRFLCDQHTNCTSITTGSKYTQCWCSQPAATCECAGSVG
jgi:hypothetical protein